MMEEENWSLEKYQRKTQQLRVTNAGLANEIESLGGAVEVTIARVEHLIMFLVHEGVIDEAQQYREQYDWEKGLREQLIPVRDRIRAHREQERKHHEAQVAAQQRAQKNGKGKDGLWVPGT